MMRWIVASSLKLRLVAAAVAALLLVFGFTELDDMPVDALPEFSRPYVEIQTEALGLSAQEVEAMITTPMEADMLNGTPWVEEIRSVSLPGLSSIVLIFQKGTDIMRARQVAQERLIEVFALPQVSKPPTMINPTSSTNRCMAIGLTSSEMSLIEMSVLARWTILPRLMGLPGVANVSLWGERKWQVQVQVEPRRLRDEKVTLMQVIKTAGNALWASPLTFLEASTPGTGGWIETPNQRLGVRHMLPIKKAAELAQVTIEGAPSKRLGDVANVVEGHQPLIGDAIVKDAPALMLIVEKFPWANTMEVTEQVEEALAALRPGLSGLEMDPTLFRPASYLELAVRNLTSALLIGGVLAVLALFAFLFNWRTVLIGTVAVLTSLIGAVSVLYVRGVTLNLVIIAGLIMAVAVVIDDAIQVMDGVARGLRRAREEGGGKSAATAIFDAVLETRGPALYATVILVLAVTPVLFLEGVSGAFWQPLATSFILALLASMAVALTVTPALSLLFLGKAPLPAADPAGTGLLRRISSALFGWATRRPDLALAGVGAVLVVGLVSTRALRQEWLLPQLRETDLVVRWEGRPSASHPAMSRIATLASRQLRSIPGVRNVSGQVGRAITSDKRSNVNVADLWVSLDPAADYDATVAAVEEVVATYPAPSSPEVLTYLEAKFREELSGTSESLVVRVYGEDTGIIGKKAEEVAGLLAKVDGVVASKVHYPQEMPTLEIEVDIERAKRHGLKPGDVRRAATTLVSGILVGSLFEEQKVFDVMVYGTPESRHSLSSVQELLIDTPGGGHVPLKDVAEVRIVPGAAEIRRDAVARRMDVAVQVRGRDLAAVAADIKRELGKVEFPLEYRAELLGEYAVRLAAQQRVLAFAVAASIGILLLLQAFLRSWRLATVLFVTLPVCLVGGVLADLSASGGLLSFGSIIGLVAVLGVGVRYAVTLLSRYRRLERDGLAFGAELVERGTQEASASILASAVTTTLAILPLALFGGIAGLEILHPMAIVVLGGLVTATLFSLVGVPAAYLRFGASREPDLGLADASAGALAPGGQVQALT